MKTYLFFDVETNGLPDDWKAEIEDVENWPRVVQIAWILANENGEEIQRKQFVIRPDNWSISPKSQEVHGISTKFAMENGVPIQQVISLFLPDLKIADCLVAHNMNFDYRVWGAELFRELGYEKMSDKNGICTMLSTTNFCALGGGYRGYKWPKLEELYSILFEETFDGAHDAMIDVEAMVRCFWELRKREVI